MKYDEYYKKDFVWGKNANSLLQKIAPDFPVGTWCLDLGCGQGRDSIFMIKNGFNVDAIDCSIEGIRKLKIYATETKIESSKSTFICDDIGNFIIKKNKYEIINIINVLHFLDKKLALELIDDVKEKIQTDGYVVISSFTTKDPSFKNSKNKLNCFFKLNELKKLFCDFEIIEYEEKTIKDKGHFGNLHPHDHGLVNLLAKKPKN